METNLNCKKEYYPGIDFLRAFSALGIVFMHVLKNGQYNVRGFVGDVFIGRMGEFVFLFMIISGFSLCCGYYEKIKKGNISLVNFYRKRYSRILPFFSIICLIDVVVEFNYIKIYELFANMTLCFGLLPNANISVVGVGWFLGVVFVFYLIFPFYCFLLESKKRAWCSFILSMVFHYLCIYYFMDDNHVLQEYDMRGNIIYAGMFFMAGGIVFLYKEKIKDIFSHKSVAVGIILLAVFLFYCIPNNSLIRLFSFSIMLMISLVISERKAIFANKIIFFISKYSLELYLSHMLFYRILEKLGLHSAFGKGAVSYVFTVILVILLSLVFAYVVNLLIAKLIKGWNQKCKLFRGKKDENISD